MYCVLANFPSFLTWDWRRLCDLKTKGLTKESAEAVLLGCLLASSTVGYLVGGSGDTLRASLVASSFDGIKNQQEAALPEEPWEMLRQ
ncbi:hypothetical protein E2562_004692 [Oryza meyeriana var. granulata]|uniref:Uncharacterized protein n=1 Tax=Oryza meyeriana var. granulata TaxID=110450 RepID=A0A6G1DE20_9ORYZ|nr:hypothetical protein E2562_004692 [Oryza meyeriana var. granulata]